MNPYLVKTLLVILFLIFSAKIFSQEVKSVTKSDTLTSKKELMERPWTVSPYSLRAGAFVATSNTSIGAGSNRVSYTNIDLEDDLGMSRNTYSLMLNFNARFRTHNRIDFSYFGINRSISAKLNKDIYFGEHSYPANAEAKLSLNTDIFRLSYGYSLITNKHWDVGALGGFHVMRYSVGMDLIGNTQSLNYKDKVKITAPLPDFGFWGTYAFFDRWAISGETSFFGMKIKNTKGRILNANFAVQYKISEHWEADLGYSYYGIKVDLTRERLNSDFNWSYGGPYANIVFKFDRFLPKP